MLWFLVVLVLWSSMEVVSKPLMGLFDPFSLTLFRFITGTVVLAAFAAIRGRLSELRSLDRRSILHLGAMGFLNTFLSMSLLQLAVLHSSPAAAATVFCSHPMMVLLFSVLAGWERFSALKTLSFAGGFTGVVLITAASPGGGWIGPVYALLGALAFASYTMLSKRICSHVSPVTANLVSFCAGVASLAGFMLLTGRPVLPPGIGSADTADLLRLAHLGILVSGMGYIAFFEALKVMPVSAASLVFFLKPALATGFAVLLAGERPSTLFIAGVALVVLSSAFNLKSVTGSCTTLTASTRR